MGAGLPPGPPPAGTLSLPPFLKPRKRAANQYDCPELDPEDRVLIKSCVVSVSKRVPVRENVKVSIEPILIPPAGFPPPIQELVDAAPMSKLPNGLAGIELLKVEAPSNEKFAEELARLDPVIRSPGLLNAKATR